MRILFTLFLFSIYCNLSAKEVDTLILRNFSFKHLPETPRTILTRIVDSSSSHDTFKITIATSDTWCDKFKPYYKIEQDTLFLGVSNDDGNCLSIYSDYYFNFSIIGVRKKYIVKWQGDVIKHTTQVFKNFPPEFKIENGKRINYKDKYGLAQGLWKLKGDRYFEGVYKDGKIVEGSFVSYDKYANKIDEEFWKDNMPSRKIYFDSQGKVIKECRFESFNEVDCKEIK